MLRIAFKKFISSLFLWVLLYECFITECSERNNIPRNKITKMSRQIFTPIIIIGKAHTNMLNFILNFYNNTVLYIPVNTLLWNNIASRYC